MAASERRHCSFLLRLWRAGNGETPEWRATLEDVASGERHSFAGLRPLADYLETLIEGDTPVGTDPNVNEGGNPCERCD